MCHVTTKNCVTGKNIIMHKVPTVMRKEKETNCEHQRKGTSLALDYTGHGGKENTCKVKLRKTQTFVIDTWMDKPTVWAPCAVTTKVETTDISRKWTPA